MLAQVSTGVNRLSEGPMTYANGVATIASGANQLERSADLVGGVQQLTQSSAGVRWAGGASKLNTGLIT